MGKINWKKLAIYFIPATLITILIIGVSFTYGTTTSGIAVGTLEGCLFVFAALYATFSNFLNPIVKKGFKKVNSFFHKFHFFKRKKKGIVNVDHNKPFDSDFKDDSQKGE